MCSSGGPRGDSQERRAGGLALAVGHMSTLEVSRAPFTWIVNHLGILRVNPGQTIDPIKPRSSATTFRPSPPGGACLNAHDAPVGSLSQRQLDLNALE
jgi:hypothetical protein